MVWLWGSLLVLLIIYFLHKEHQDRKRPTLIGELVQGDGFAPPLKKDLTKSWWERISAFVKALLLYGLFIVGGWLIHDLMMIFYG